MTTVELYEEISVVDYKIKSLEAIKVKLCNKKVHLSNSIIRKLAFRCPHCGGVPKIHILYNHKYNHKYEIRCGNPKCKGLHKCKQHKLIGDSISEAVSKWNRYVIQEN